MIMATASMATQLDDPRIIEFDVRTDEMLVNMGPQHPSTHGVLRLVLRTDGEVVSEVDAAHRLPAPLRREDRREPHAAAVDSVHRPDGLPGRDEHESRLVAGRREAVQHEAAREGAAPARDHRRAEPHRQPPGRHGRLRPRPGHVQPVPVRLPRARKDPRPVRGSLRCPADLQLHHASAARRPTCRRGWLQKCEAFLDQFEPVIDEYHTLLTTNAIFVKRTAGIGVLSPEMAIDYGCTGPVLRGSGVDYDLRRDGEERYTEMYDGYAFEVIVRDERPLSARTTTIRPCPSEAVLGDCWHRFYVRMLEVVQSIDLVRQAIDRYSTANGYVRRADQAHRRSCPRAKPIWKPKPRAARWASIIVSDGSADPLAGPRPQQLLLQPLGHARALPRLPDRRRAGHRRLAGHRDGRDRPLESRRFDAAVLGDALSQSQRRKTGCRGACRSRVVCAIFHDLRKLSARCVTAASSHDAARSQQLAANLESVAVSVRTAIGG